MKNKICPVCGINKNEKDYYRRSGKNKHLFRSYCIECEKKLSKKWHYENLEYIHKREKQYRDNNPEKRRKREKIYNKNNRDKIRKKEQKYREKYPEKVREKSRRYKSRKKELVHSFTLKQWKNKIRRTKGRCKCGNLFKEVYPFCVTQDHEPPISKAPSGFEYKIKHITPLCGACNNSKGSKITDYRLQQLKLTLK